jgi:CO/xanthine dehydrogenase FAD-binding subunit
LQAFSYEAPKTLEQAISILGRLGEKGRALCGGTDLIVQMRAGVKRPECVVDIKGIAELGRLEYEAGKGLRLGAAVACTEVSANREVRRYYPGLAEAAHLIGSVQIQNRASVGGNLCNGSPAADSVGALVALGAVARIAGPKGMREVEVEKFCTAPGRTVLGAGELLVELGIKAPRAHSADAYLRITPRNEMDIAIVGVGAWVAMDGERCAAARIGLGAVGPTPIFAAQASQWLTGKKLDEETLERAAGLAVEASAPIDDMRGTAEYRRHLVGVLTKRALRIAAERASNGKGI